MININNKAWEKLRAADIVKLLSGDIETDENFFFEFKDDREKNDKFIKEVSAFSNTYGGYILLGVNDDKTIGGCKDWNEQRIHNVIYNCITPIPDFDVKRFKINGNTVYVVKIEEGAMPPYITNAGKIYERVSSGSMPIQNSSKLSQLYTKREDQLKRIHRKIELASIPVDALLPGNICGHLDIGFSLTCSEKTQLEKKFYDVDFSKVRDYLTKLKSPYSISRSGESYIINIGKAGGRDNQGEAVLLGDGVNNFIEILYDGSVRCRAIIVTNENDKEHANLFLISGMLVAFREIYEAIMDEPLHKIFLYAQKYEQLHVIRQFIPTYDVKGINDSELERNYTTYVENHTAKYGNNTMIVGNRIPRNDFKIRDKRWFQTYNIPFTTENIIDELFSSAFFNMGFIDPYVSVSNGGNTEKTE